MKRADQILPAVLCGSLVLGLWAAPLRAQAQNQLASVGAAALATPEELSEQEVIRRKEQLIRGQKALADAEAAMKAGDFDKAAEYYTNALNTLPRGNVAAKEIATARAGVINAYISKGRASVRTKNYDDARKSADEVLKYDPNNGAAKNIIKVAEQATTRPAPPQATADSVPRTLPPVDETPEFKKSQNQATQLLRDARLAFQSNQLDLAAEKINLAMVQDRYNEEARTLLREVNEQRYHAASVDMGRVRMQYAADTLEAWAPPIRMPRGSGPQRPVETQKIPVEKEKLNHKLDTIRLPKIEFREANIVDVVNFLAEQSRAIDKLQGGNGINIVFAGGLSTAGGGAAPAPEAPAPAPAPMAPAAPGAAPVPGAAPGAPGADAAPAPAAPAAPAPVAPAATTPAPGGGSIGGTPAITLNLLDVPLRDALRYVTDIAGLKFIVENYAVLIVPPNYVSPGQMVTRNFNVPPGIFTAVVTGTPPTGGPGGGAPGGAGAAPTPAPAANATPSTGGGAQVSSDDIKKFFTDAGVKFDPPASVTYQAATSQLFVTNTPDSLATIEQILDTLRRAQGQQVTIEAKFIEIQQTDLRELGFDWVLGQWGFGSIGGIGAPGNPAFAVGGGSANNGTFPVYPSDLTATPTQNLTVGNRFASQAGTLVGNKLDALLTGQTATSQTVADSVATFTGLLTNPQFQVILRALSQRENTDLLCAPKVTTISGQQAKIEVIREFIYPTEFEPPRVASAASSAATSGAAVSAPMISPPTPGGFQTRNLGVTLNVTPQIGETGLINLTLIPEVSDFDGFVDYGSRDSLGSSGINNPSAASQYTLVFPYPQPVFSVRRVTTSVMVYDGSTVVLGGLIREDATKIQDKVPFLGDIPLIGKLFRNELENTIKKNLMVFVTAKLIDPYGDLISRATTTTATTMPTEVTPTGPTASAPAAPRP